MTRRTRLALGPTGGLDSALPAAILVGECLGWSPAQVRAEAAELLRIRARSRAPGVGLAQARAEPLARAAAALLSGAGEKEVGEGLR